MQVKRVAIALLVAHILSLMGFSTYAVALTQLQADWGLSNSQAGWIASGFFIGYVATVSTWSSLTDVMDARRIYMAGSLIAASGGMGFAIGAEGFLSALFFQLMLGVGIAATYMPGLKILSDRTRGVEQSRFVAFYTAFFGFGAASSLFVTGLALPHIGTHWTFFLCALGPLVAGLIVLSRTRPLAHERNPAPIQWSWQRLFPVATWRLILADRRCLGFTVGYGVHCAELFGSRAWIVAFLSFSAALMPSGSFTPFSAATAAAVVSIFSVASSILGNEVALKVGRRAWIVVVMVCTGLAGIAMALCAGSAWWVVFLLLTGYTVLVMADSATLTAGMVASADPKVKGAAMGLYSLIGFGGGGVLGPAIFGGALDLAGGGTAPSDWAIGFAALGAGCMLFPVFDWWLHRSNPFRSR
ncbi:MFS transporter [beta proteobacterium MWH-UniP1]